MFIIHILKYVLLSKKKMAKISLAILINIQVLHLLI